MIYLDEIKPLLLYRKKFHLPVNEKNKRKNSSIILLTPNIKSSIDLINHPLAINRYHNGYYIEKDITYIINGNNIVGNADELDATLENGEYTINNKDAIIQENLSLDVMDIVKDDYKFKDDFLVVNTEGSTTLLLFNDSLDKDTEGIQEASLNYNAILKRLLYKERFKKSREVLEVYNNIKMECPKINRTFLNYEKHKNFNLFVDFYYYNETFFKNNMYRLNRGLDLYLDFISRFINDNRLEKSGYNIKYVFIPVNDWNKASNNDKFHMYNEDINPISIIYRLMMKDINRLKEAWGDIPFIFIGENSYFKVDFSNITRRDVPRFLNNINRLKQYDYIPDKEEIEIDMNTKESPKSIVSNIIDKIESNSNIKINNLTGAGNTTKDELVKRIEKAAITSKDIEEVEEELENDDEIKQMLIDISNDEDNAVKINVARSSRMTKLNDDFFKKEVDGTTIDKIIGKNTVSEIPKIELNIDTVNEDIKNLTYTNFEKSYNMQDDIFQMIDSLSSNKSLPISVRDLTIEDTSTSEDYVKTYTFAMEDSFGKRFNVVLDIPDFKDDLFLVLKGNEKAINRQLILLPVIKTDDDTVQIVTNYNKIFLTRFGSKSFVISDRLIKTINKIDESFKNITVKNGDCTISNKNYILPIDYIELSKEFTTINTPRYTFYFSQKEIMNKYELKPDKDKFPIAYDNHEKQVIYCEYSQIYSIKLHELLFSQNSKLIELYANQKPSKRYSYTRASILNAKVPLIVILSYNEGLLNVLKKAKINYDIVEKRPNLNLDTHDMIKFKDGYLVYDLNYETSLLLNGLKECNTEDYSIKELSNKEMYLNFLDLFGGRIIADGLDNFYELMIDPITKEVLTKYNLPTDYVEILIYGNNLLADSKYVHHTDMSGVRYRSNEIVAACVYKVLAKSYGDYKLEIKRRRKNASMTVKKSAVIDELLALPIVADASMLSPVLEGETLHTVSTKGPSGMNSERAYGLDKRAYHSSMINLLGMSTIQGPGVGINRQSTIDMNIEGSRGYIKTTSNIDNMSVAKSLTISEALSPFGVIQDDPPRTSMNLSQAKHMMRIKDGDPLLISNGMDQALPYMLSNTFSYKTKDSGKVEVITEDYMILKYDNGSSDFIDLRNNIKKNSSSGFYINIKLDTDFKVGQRFKKDTIIAYDKESYSTKVGHTNNISYNIGALVKVALLNTDEGFEDSAIISNRLSKRMASDVVIKKEVIIGKNANIYSMVKKGQKVQEGDSLIVFQNSYEDDDINILLRNLVGDEDEITDIGRIPVKSKYTGVIEDIKIYRTVDKSELSPSLQKKINEVEKPIKDMKNVMKQYNVPNINRFNEPDYKLDPTGKLKNVKDGVLIEFYIKYEDEMAVGDKLTYFIALKGIVRDIFPEGEEPYTDFRPDEKVESLLAIASVNARQTCSVITNMTLNKILIELGRSVKDILGIKYDVNE